MPHAPRSARKCEGRDPHTPKAIFTWGVGVPVDSRNFIEQLQRSKPLAWKSYLYHWKALDEGYNFDLDLIPIEGLHKKL
jgi:hypothetical protein